ncbi:MAG: hypothetical protein IKA90_03845 [Clostridia bacterium]|nr:hypothetical protein [Clostridia bacterium]
MNSKIKSYVGFAINKCDLVLGLDNIKKSKKAPKLVIIASDASEKTKKEAKFCCQKFKAVLIECGKSVEELVEKPGVKVFSMTDNNLIKAILQNLDEDFKCVEVVN